MSVVKEFREFVARGNVVDLAVGVVMGTAFGKIVSSVVGDVIMPPVGLVIGGVSLNQFKVVLREAAGAHPAVTLNYGAFLQAIFDFVVIAFSVFLLVKGVNSLHRKAPPPAPAAPPVEVQLLTEIRDALVKR